MNTTITPRGSVFAWLPDSRREAEDGADLPLLDITQADSALHGYRPLVSLARRQVTISAQSYRLPARSRCLPGPLKKMAASAWLMAGKLSYGVRHCLNPEWLLTAATVTGLTLAVGSMATMAGMTGGFSAASLLPNAVAGATASQTGVILGLGGAMMLSVIGGCAHGCWRSCQFLCRSQESRLLESYRRAFEEMQRIRQQELRTLGPLAQGRTERLDYLSDYMQEREQACIRILEGRNLSEEQLQAYGFSCQTA